MFRLSLSITALLLTAFCANAGPAAPSRNDVTVRAAAGDGHPAPIPAATRRTIVVDDDDRGER